MLVLLFPSRNHDMVPGCCQGEGLGWGAGVSIGTGSKQEGAQILKRHLHPSPALLLSVRPSRQRPKKRPPKQPVIPEAKWKTAHLVRYSSIFLITTQLSNFANCLFHSGQETIFHEGIYLQHSTLAA